jgi:alpha-N-arabinofuranosidase
MEPMMAVNLGTRGVEDAVRLLEYCNHSGGTELSDRRAAHGDKEPYGIRMWCLGNEMDGPWQLGHKTAGEYGRVAAETARAMRMLDPGLELVACGSSGGWMPTFVQWERTVLEHAYDLVDYVSLHAYFEEGEAGDLASFLASGVVLDRFIDAVVEAADGVGDALGSAKRIQVSVDEWNVWYLRRFQAQPLPGDWPAAPSLAEDDYSVADAVVVGALLISLLRHADRVAGPSRNLLLRHHMYDLLPIVARSGQRGRRDSEREQRHAFASTKSAPHVEGGVRSRSLHRTRGGGLRGHRAQHRSS